MIPTQDEMSTAIRRLKSWCIEHRLEWPESAESQFETYFRLLFHYQKQTNLTGFHTPNELVNHLCIDSLQILRTGQIPAPMLDVGSGAGFPAIPIKILRPDLETILVEPRTKRYAFLRRVETDLHLTQMTILHSKIESAILPESMGLAISKAFMPILDWVRLATPWAKQGSQLACLVSKSDWIAAIPELEKMGFITRDMIEENDRVYAILVFDSNKPYSSD